MPDDFEFSETGLDGLKIIRWQPHDDNRGSFSRIFCAKSLHFCGFTSPISQINYSKSKEIGTVRGLHFQHPPHTETKIVNCFKGCVFDVAVDLRCGSSTFLQWRGVILSGNISNSLLIPAGFAHGFQTLEPDCELLYFHSKAYHPEANGGLHPADSRLNISWPLPIANLSNRDQNLPFLTPEFQGIPL